MTHWFITETKAQEIQRDDAMEALREWLPDLETTHILVKPSRKKMIENIRTNCRVHAEATLCQS